MASRTPNSVIAAALASRFAAEIGLKPGNLWEPPITRAIAKDLSLYTRESVERHWRLKLGL